MRVGRGVGVRVGGEWVGGESGRGVEGEGGDGSGFGVRVGRGVGWR